MVDQQLVIAQFRTWFDAFQDYDFDPQGRLNVYGTVIAKHPHRHIHNNRLPFRFGRVEGDFNVSYCGLNTFEGMPYYVKHTCWISHNSATTLVGLPNHCNSLVMEGLSELASFEGFPEQVDLCRFTWYPQQPLLRLLQAKRIQLGITQMTPADNPARKVVDILKNYAGQGQKGALACAAELAKAGFKDNARW